MRYLCAHLLYLFSRAQRRNWEDVKDRDMVSHDLLRRILRLHSHGQIIITYRPHPVPFERLAGYFALTIQAQLCYNIQDFPIPEFSQHDL